MKLTLIPTAALLNLALFLAAPTAVAEESDLDPRTLRAVSQTETTHRTRLARIARLREIATQQSDRRRLRELDHLEREQRALYKERVESAKKEFGRVAVRRVSDHLGLSGDAGRSPDFLSRGAPAPRTSRRSTGAAARPPMDAVPPNRPAMTVPAVEGTATPPSDTEAGAAANQTQKPPKMTTVPPQNNYQAPRAEDNQKLREKVQDQRARERRRKARAREKNQAGDGGPLGKTEGGKKSRKDRKGAAGGALKDGSR